MSDRSDATRPSDPNDQTKGTARKTTQDSTNAAQKGAAGLERAGQAAAETTRTEAEGGTEALRHLGQFVGQTSSKSSGCIADAQQEFLNGVADQFEEALDRVTATMRQSAQEWRALMELPNMAEGGLQDIQRCVGDAVETVVRSNLQASKEMIRLANPVAFAGLQQRFVRDYMHALLEGSTNVVRCVQKSAEHALRPLEGGNGQRDDARNSRRVADVMQREVHLVNPDDTVQQAAKLMREADTGALPVGEGDRLIGMVTDRDVAVRLAADGKDPARTKVRDVMTPDVRYVFADEDVGHVAENMAQQQVRRLPVMNRQKRLVGVVSLGDIAKAGEPRLAGRALRGIAREGGQHTQAAAQ